MNDSHRPSEPRTEGNNGRHRRLRDLYQIVVDCRDEHQQRRLYEHLTNRGHRCKVLTL